MANTKTITSANVNITITCPGVFDQPVKLSGFSTDDVFDNDDIEPFEGQMGVDGRLSAGFINRETKVKYHFQADSDSIEVFETIFAAEKAAQEKFPIFGAANIPATKKTFAMTRGFLSRMKQMADAGKTLKPQTFEITWQDISPAPLG